MWKPWEDIPSQKTPAVLSRDARSLSQLASHPHVNSSFWAGKCSTQLYGFLVEFSVPAHLQRATSDELTQVSVLGYSLLSLLPASHAPAHEWQAAVCLHILRPAQSTGTMSHNRMTLNNASVICMHNMNILMVTSLCNKPEYYTMVFSILGIIHLVKCVPCTMECMLTLDLSIYYKCQTHAGHHVDITWFNIDFLISWFIFNNKICLFFFLILTPTLN